MTWNILVGGGGRLPAIEAVIRRVRPDVLALQELRGFPLGSFSGAVGMTGFAAPSVFGQAVGLLVRPPLTPSGTRKVRLRLHHAAAVATVGAGLTVISTHLNPLSPYRRYREARWLAARYGDRDTMVLIAGDLNSLDPVGDHTAAVARLAPAYRIRHAGVDGIPDTRALSTFLAAGFVDVGAGLGPTAPTDGVGGAEFSGMRLDYILATPPLAARLQHIEVLRIPETDHASDHYPVVAEFDL